jgi:hypothetical protein
VRSVVDRGRFCARFQAPWRNLVQAIRHGLAGAGSTHVSPILLDTAPRAVEGVRGSFDAPPSCETFDGRESQRVVQQAGCDGFSNIRLRNASGRLALLVRDPNNNRVWVGNTEDGAATVALMDTQGRRRIVMEVKADGSSNLDVPRYEWQGAQSAVAIGSSTMRWRRKEWRPPTPYLLLQESWDLTHCGPDRAQSP